MLRNAAVRLDLLPLAFVTMAAATALFSGSARAALAPPPSTSSPMPEITMGPMPGMTMGPASPTPPMPMPMSSAMPMRDDMEAAGAPMSAMDMQSVIDLGDSM